MSLLPESYDIPHQVDLGNVFDAVKEWVDVAALGIVRIGFTTGKYPIYIFDRSLSFVGSSRIIYSAYMDSSYTGGTAIPLLNANHEYFRASTCTAVFEPIVNTLGEIYLGPRATYSAGAGGSRLGNDAAALKPTLLKANTQHIFTIYNPSTKADFLQWTAAFFEDVT